MRVKIIIDLSVTQLAALLSFLMISPNATPQMSGLYLFWDGTPQSTHSQTKTWVTVPRFPIVTNSASPTGVTPWKGFSLEAYDSTHLL